MPAAPRGWSGGLGQFCGPVSMPVARPDARVAEDWGGLAGCPRVGSFWDTWLVPGQDVVGDEVRQFAEELKQRLLQGRFRHVKAFADRPELTGVGRSTVYEALRGLRVPSDVTVAALLSRVAEAEPQEIGDWLERRARLADEAALATHPPLIDPPPPSLTPPGSGVPQPWSTGRFRRLTAAVLVAAGVVAGVGGTLLVEQLLPTPKAMTAGSCSPSPDLRSGAVAARTANTQGEGVYAYTGPDGRCRSGFLGEQMPISVVCQVLHGKDITDTYRNAVRRWTVWDKLSSGAYVPDLYTDLPKGTTPTLVDGLPAC